ncbi:YceD family protein [Pajaroellobacter abortibovis]|uniref:23S rRNA accumulation protein YceD n=1 Tax=Pajaroellobacter abortibovis TaxID=1882918 RepID=A0A1L6MXY8_9BACT|nr:DUF177 domain-containing protein [Pajaroellobacter abortibovis]APS00265.1 hypothetical protein BCY86_05880 [Pajaroellobacter abortibovis]
MHDFVISLHDLDAGGREFTFPLHVDWVQQSLEGYQVIPTPTEGEACVRASKSGQDIVIHGSLHAQVVVPCARCLQDTTIALEPTITALFVPASGSRHAYKDQEEYEFLQEEADLISYEGETIVLNQLIRDELILSLPMIPLCSEACPGIISTDFINESVQEYLDPVDPRLLPLLKLKEIISHNPPKE